MSQVVRAIVTELRRALESLYGPRLAQMVLFGSQARGDAEAASDVDVLVVLDGEVCATEEIGRTGALVSDLSLKYDTVVSCVFLAADRFWAERSPFVLNVRREGVAV